MDGQVCIHTHSLLAKVASTLQNFSVMNRIYKHYLNDNNIIKCFFDIKQKLLQYLSCFKKSWLTDQLESFLKVLALSVELFLE